MYGGSSRNSYRETIHWQAFNEAGLIDRYARNVRYCGRKAYESRLPMVAFGR